MINEFVVYGMAYYLVDMLEQISKGEFTFSGDERASRCLYFLRDHGLITDPFASHSTPNQIRTAHRQAKDNSVELRRCRIDLTQGERAGIDVTVFS